MGVTITAWMPVGPGEHRPDEVQAEVEHVLRQRASALTTGANCSGEEEDEDRQQVGVYYQRCGGGRRVLRKRIGGA